MQQLFQRETAYLGIQTRLYPYAHSDNGYTVLARSFILHTGVPVWCFTNSRYLSHPGIAIGFMNDFDDTIHYNTGQGEFNKMFVNGELLAERSQYKSCCGAVVYMEKNSHFAVNKIDLSEYFGASCKDTFLLNQNIADFDENTLNEIVTLASCLENDGEKFVQYFPSPVQEKEKNLMLKVLQTYIPTERNGGWIPHMICVFFCPTVLPKRI